MKQNIDLMIGYPSTGPDQLPANARNQAQEVAATVLAAAAFCIGAVGAGVPAPRPQSVTIVAIETANLIPQQITPKKLQKQDQTRAVYRR